MNAAYGIPRTPEYYNNTVKVPWTGGSRIFAFTANFSFIIVTFPKLICSFDDCGNPTLDQY